MNKKSQQVIDETFALYGDGGAIVPNSLKGRTIIHMYPQEDTIREDGELDGYYQTLFFKMVVFNIPKNGENKMYKPSRKYDAIFIDKCNVRNLSVFKDGAFCTTIEGDVKFLDGQAPTFYVENK